jgi:gliding motility-associated-like protein
MARFDPEQAEDCAPLVTGFENNSRNADYYNWDFGDGVTSSQDEPLHKFTNTTGQDTTYEVKLVSSSAFECIDSVTKTVTVNAQPNAEFTIQEGFDLQKWPESEVVFDNESNSGPWDYTWSFDDGQQSHEREPGSHDYDHWGEYTIGLDIVSNTSTCSDNISKDIEILPPEIHADFSMRNFKGCEPLEVEFNGQESPFNESYQYEWDFGDGTTGRGRLVSHQYDSAGTYYVKMTARAEGGTEIAYDTVVVYKRPEVEFEVDPTLVMLPDQKMHCYNFTDYARTYSWDFGDGSGNSTKEAPLHQYKELGTYTVTLTAWSEEHTCADGNTLVTCRCRDRDSLSNVVEVRGKGHIEFPNAFTPSPSGPSNGYWDPEATDNDIFHPVGEGIKNYTLEIYNKWGERLFISHKFEVGWDGYYKGRLLPQDVYIWKAEGEFYNGKSFEKMGDVTLLRNFPNGDGED